MKNEVNQAHRRVWEDESFLGSTNGEAFPMCKNCLFRNKTIENGYKKGVCYLYRGGKDIKPYKLYKGLASCPYKVIDNGAEDINLDGGPGSGHWGHAGRPGEIGGSTEGGGVAFRLTTPSGGFTGLNGAYKENEKHNKAKEGKSKATNTQKASGPKADMALAVKNFKSNFNGPIPFPEISKFVKSKEMLDKLMQFPKGTEIKYSVHKVTFNGKDWIGPGKYVNDADDLINICYGVVQGMLGKSDLVIKLPSKEMQEEAKPKTTSATDKVKQIQDILVQGAAKKAYQSSTPEYQSAKDALKSLPQGTKIMFNGNVFKKSGNDFKLEGMGSIYDETCGTMGVKLMKAINFGHGVDIKVPDGADFNLPQSTNTTTPTVTPPSSKPINPVPKTNFKLPKIFKNIPMTTPQESWNSMIEVAHKVWSNCDEFTRKTFKSYTQTGFRKINSELRGITDDGDRDIEIDLMTQAISQSSYKFDKQLVRGVGTGTLRSMLGAAGQDSTIDFSSLNSNQLNTVLKDKPMTELAFASCGTSKGTGFDDKPVLLHIAAPAGTQMMYISPYSDFGANLTNETLEEMQKMKNYSSEDETILQRGTEFRCYGAQKDKSGQIHVYMKVVKQKLDMT